MMKVLRSVIHECFPLELRVELDLVSRRRDLIKDEKPQEILKLLRKYNVADVTPLGPGTNRYAFKIKGFVCKVATDHDGKIDNLKEFKMSKRLYPDVTKTYEVSTNGSLLIAEYISPFESYAAMMGRADEIREILRRISSVYLIGDVGITSKNYVNWGVRVGYDKPVCLDFAYIYDVSSDLFVCRACKANAILVPNKDYTELVCSNEACQKRYLFEDIRARIGNDIHNHEIGDLTEEGYLLYESNVPTELTPERSNYLQTQVVEKKKDKEPEEEVIPDDFQMAHPPEFYLNQYNFQGGNDMERFTQTDVAAKFAKARVIEATAVSVKGAVVTPSTEVFSGKIDAPVYEAEAVVVPANKVEVVNKPKPVEKPEATVETVVAAINDGAIPPGTEHSVKVEPKLEGKSIDEATDEELGITEPDTMITEEEFVQMMGYDIDAAELDEINNKDWSLDESFIADFQKAISDISNDVEAWLENLNIYEPVSGEIISSEIQTEPEFYKAVQNAVFRSLCNYFDLECKEIPDKNKLSGIRREWKKTTKDYSSETVHASARFLAEYYYGGDIHENTELKFRDAFREAWPGRPFGFNEEWIQFFNDRLLSKVEISDAGMDILNETIKRYWCQIDASGYDDYNEFELLDEDDEYYDDGLITDEEIIQTSADAEPSEEQPVTDEPADVVDTSAEPEQTEEPTATVATVIEAKAEVVTPEEKEPEVAFEGTIGTDSTSEDEEYYYDDEFTSIQIYPAADGTRDCTVVYEHSDEDGIDSHLEYEFKEDFKYQAAFTDPRNGDWDWMTHLYPRTMFATADPDRWIRRAYDNRSSVKFLVVKRETATEPAIMAVYEEPDISLMADDNEIDIFKYDENELEIPNNEYLHIINTVASTIAGTALDQLPIVLKNGTIHQESEMEELFSSVLSDISDDAEDKLEDMNDVAAQFLLNDANVQPEQPQTFKPIHRPKTN